MDKIEQHRKFVLDFYKALNGKIKTNDVLAQFTSDPKLIEHLLSLEELLPKFKLIPEEITTEQNRVIVKAILSGIPISTNKDSEKYKKTIKTTFATGYTIKNKKIINHWFITDQMELFRQLQNRKPP